MAAKPQWRADCPACWVYTCGKSGMSTSTEPSTPALASGRRLPSPPRIFYGWWILAAGTLTMTIVGATSNYGLALLFVPLTTEFGWSRAALSGALSLARLEGGMCRVLPRSRRHYTASATELVECYLPFLGSCLGSCIGTGYGHRAPLSGLIQGSEFCITLSGRERTRGFRD